jgi:FixJ family two-component response regulator
MAASNTKTTAIVDDNRRLRAPIKDPLEKEGFASECYSRAEDFLLQEGYLPADCILADVRMTACLASKCCVSSSIGTFTRQS